MSDKLAVIILAAGLGKRMGVLLPKVAVYTREMPLIRHVLEAVAPLKADRVVVVSGHQKEVVEKLARDFCNEKSLPVSFAFQEKQLGTGDAVKASLPELENFSGSILILCGDTPLITSDSLNKIIKSHSENKATVSLISFIVEETNNYGRIIRDPKTGQALKIVEAKDCTEAELKISEVNSGIYLVDSAFLNPAIKELKNENVQKEYYLTDILERAAKEGQTINAVILPDGTEVLGVNTLSDLNKVNRVLIMKKIKELMDSGVQFDLPETCVIDSAVEIEAGVKVGPNTQILGKTKVAKGTLIEGNSYIKDCELGENVTVKFSVRMENSRVGNNCGVGPFAHLRPGTILEDESRVGNFVETKKATLGKGSKANHLTYLGDCVVGKDSNIGAGTITCNYDGYVKSQTTIGDNVFIGSNTALVAPVTVEDGASVGAGSVITKKVVKDSLAFTRAPQVSKAGWSKSKRERKN